MELVLLSILTIIELLLTILELTRDPLLEVAALCPKSLTSLKLSRRRWPDRCLGMAWEMPGDRALRAECNGVLGTKC